MGLCEHINEQKTSCSHFFELCVQEALFLKNSPGGVGHMFNTKVNI